MLPQPSRRGPESNRCAGLCRPLPKPLGHPAGMEQPGVPGLAASLTCDRSAGRSSLRGRSRRTLASWTRRIGVLSAGPTSFERRPAKVTSRWWSAGCATGRLIPGSDAHPQIGPRTSRSVDCSRRRSRRRNKSTVPEDRTSPRFVVRCYAFETLSITLIGPFGSGRTHTVPSPFESKAAIALSGSGRSGGGGNALRTSLIVSGPMKAVGQPRVGVFAPAGATNVPTDTRAKTATASNRVLIRWSLPSLTLVRP
jgi:hypothetical protein